MRELEAKLRVHGSPDEVLDFLVAAGMKFSPPVEQTDFVFAKSVGELLSPSRGTTIARVRVDSQAPASLTVKTRRGRDLDRDEEETTVGDPEAARRILSALGFDQIVIVSKTRFTAKLGSTITILLDEVDDLGTFIEIEVIGEHASSGRIEEVQQKLRELIAIDLDPISKGYDRLLLEKKDAAASVSVDSVTGTEPSPSSKPFRSKSK
jgi:predicted adenylyl cyclase CyaB